MVYIVIHAGILDAFHDKAKAEAWFKSQLITAWDECIKFSCPKGEFYDDRLFTFDKCLDLKDAVINGKHYAMMPVLYLD